MGSSLEISLLGILAGGIIAHLKVESCGRHDSSQWNSGSRNKLMKRSRSNRICHIVCSLMFYICLVCLRLLFLPFLPLPSLYPLLLPSPSTSLCNLQLHSSKHSSILEHTPATTTQHTNRHNSYNATASMGKVKWDSAADQIVSFFARSFDFSHCPSRLKQSDFPLCFAGPAIHLIRQTFVTVTTNGQEISMMHSEGCASAIWQHV